jgi:uncharacterized membrane-anchored protein YhcB (DUF1043 family)
MNGKRKRKPSGKTRIQQKANRRFRISKTLTAGISIIGWTSAGAYYGRKIGMQKLAQAEKKREGNREFEKLITKQVVETAKTIKVKPESDTCQQELKQVMKHYNIDECSECGQELTQRYNELSKELANERIMSVITHLSGTKELDAEVRAARDEIPTKMWIGAGVGFVPGLIIALVSVAFLEQARLKIQRHAQRKRLLEAKKREEELRRKQIEETKQRDAPQSNGNSRPPLAPVESVEIHLERLEEREELIKKLEKAIRSVCGRRCSGEVALSLVSELTDRIAAMISDEPEKLSKVLIENKAKLNPVLDRYGWSVDEVLVEIHSKREK